MKRKLRATCPDGRIVHRTTDRDYTHVVIVMITAEAIEKATGKVDSTPQNPHWKAKHWCSRFAMAMKASRTWIGRGWDVKIIPVDPQPISTKEKDNA